MDYFIFELMKPKWIFFAIVALALGACTSKRIAVQVLRPAEVTIPRSVLKIGVMDRSYIAGNAAQVFENGQMTNRFLNLKKVGAEKTAEGFYVEFSAFKRFNTITVASTEKVDSNAKSVPKAPETLLRKLAADSALDALITLEGYRVDILTDGNVYTSVYYDAFGFPYAVPRFQSSRSIKVTTFWRMYNLKNNAVIQEKVMETTLNFASNGYSSDEAYRNLPERRGSVENASQVAGIRYAETLMPYWQNSERKIYTASQTDRWLEAADSAEVGNWESAAEQWNRLVKKPLRVTQKQAVYNMFVACEVLGDFEKADYWAKLGQRKFKTREFDEAVLFLDKRRVENSELDEQLNE